MCLTIQKEGILTSLQGLADYGLQRFGVNPRGAMDRTAIRLINLLLGNAEDEEVLELHFPAGELRFDESCLFALGGADFSAELDGVPVENWRIFETGSSAVLRFRRKSTGERCYLAVPGGLAVEGHPAAYQTEGLARGTSLLRARTPNAHTRVGTGLSPGIIPPYRASPEIRVLPCAEFDDLSAHSMDAFQSSTFEISRASDRMGFRLNGSGLALERPVELVSASVTFGTIQLLPDGQLIVLMADHQTTGGYPRLATVVSPDLPLLAQSGPGDKIRFRPVEVAEAEKLSRDLEAELLRLKTGLSFGRYW